MPKRIVHGEGIWRSDKLARVQPEWIRAEYANLLPQALANGVFEYNPRRIWAEVYSYNRPSVTLETVEKEILPAVRGVGLLFVWTGEDGKEYGFWPGIEKSGRLPSPSRLAKGHDAVGPTPPEDLLAEYLASTRNGNGQSVANHKVASGQVGIGSGIGTGSGSGSGSGSGGRRKRARTAQMSKPSSPSAFRGLHLIITKRQDKALAEAFPWVDRQQEYKKADSWCEANSKRRPKKYSPFIHNWFGKIIEPRKGGSRAEERTRKNLDNREEFLHNTR